jgi:hypothetical protein
MSISRNTAAALRLMFVVLTVSILTLGVAAAQKKTTPSAPHPSAPSHTSASHTATSHPSNTSRANAASRTGASGTSRNVGTRSNTRNTSSFGNRTGGRSAGMTNRTAAGRNNSAAGRNTAMGGRTASVSRPGARSLPGRQVSLRGGGTASIRPNGQIRSINRNGMQINRGLNGSRHIESMHNGARVVSTGRGAGYVQRTYVVRGGHTYYSRTYYYHGAYHVGVYRGYSWHGHTYYGYYHPYWYHPVFYGWAYNPWPAPVYWGWGWGGAPWYGYYGGYFAPYPVYPSAAFWLTDYLIASQLQAAYAAQQAAAANAAADAAAANAAPSNPPADQQQDNGGEQPSAQSSGQVTLTPEVKEAIAEEVKAQLAAQQSQAQQQSSTGSQPASSGSPQQASNTDEVPPALDPARRTFVVDTDLTVNADGQECQLTSGDVLTRLTDSPDSDGNVNVSVQASKAKDCSSGKQAAVSVDDLEEMHNHFQEQLDGGMKELAAKQGTGGLPKAPDTSTTASDVPAPPPDQSAAKAVDDQQAQADQVEAQVSKEAFSQGS